MNVIGKTTDGKLVVSGLGKLYFETGLPLSIVFDRMVQGNYQPSWIHLYLELKENGMKHDRIIHLLNEHIFESYGKEYRDEVIRRLELIRETGYLDTVPPPTSV
jgi:hypothetical protein